MTTLQSPQHVIFSQPAEIYHASPAWGASMLKTFRFRRAKCRDVFVTGARLQDPPSPQMEFGTIIHSVLLDQRDVDEVCAVYPTNILAKNGAASTGAVKNFAAVARASRQFPMKLDDYDRILECRDSFLRTFGRWRVLATHTEQSIYWTDSLTGLPCKARPDWICKTADSWFIFDLKTTNNAHPAAFRKKIEGTGDETGYWLQAAHYLAGVQAVLGGNATFKFVAVQTDYPYSCAVHEVDPESMTLAQSERDVTLISLKRCLDSGDWTEPWERNINTIKLWPRCFDTN